MPIFHPLIEKWFATYFGRPTDVQERAWEKISSGRHVLITAPTGSGKTLSAFLYAINQLVDGSWPCGQTRILYVSPLKALNNDVQRNLKAPLKEIRRVFDGANESFPEIQVATRSGDTPPAERRRMQRIPPEILITTPESLNILITSASGCRMLAGLKTVILDEIHAVIGSKRGVHLLSAVNRLTRLSGEFQRIALTATIRPLDKAAELVGGYTYMLNGDPDTVAYRKREVAIVRSSMLKKVEIRVDYPEAAWQATRADIRWQALTTTLKHIISANKSTLLFTNSRRMTEKLTRLLNADEPVPLAYAHHGSLSREIRLAVEQRLKNGMLKAIVATRSLELGIDIGQLDQVVLVQTPMSVSSAIQRIGRAGHGVGDVSRGVLFPLHGRDFIEAAAMAGCVAAGDIEPFQSVTCPLDVLSQIIVSMCVTETWDLDALFAFIRSDASYVELSRRQFDLVVAMLAGRYADTRIRELKPRVAVDRIDNTIKSRDGAAFLIYMAGGTIPDRGYFDMRIRESRTKIGELDEEFVWERTEGDTFAMGAQTWRIQKISANEVTVTPAGGGGSMIPFWRAEARHRDFHYAEKICVFLEAADRMVRDDESVCASWLESRYAMTPTAAAALTAFLKRQTAAVPAPLPHRRHILVEHFNDPVNHADSSQVILHTVWGGRVNRPLALAIAAYWESRYGHPLEVYADNDGILLVLPHDFDPLELFHAVNADTVTALVRDKLEQTGFFGARFRENAGRALLLPGFGFRRRMPLWLNRLRAKKLMAAIRGKSDFPLLLETWRTCLQDEFDLPALKQLLDEITTGRIKISRVSTVAPSPFAAGLVWQQTNQHMYADDSPAGSGVSSSLSDTLIREIAGSAALRPAIIDSVIDDFCQRLQRVAEGYAPIDAGDLLEWVKDRRLIPEDEWDVLLAAMQRDHGLKNAAISTALDPKVVRIRLPGAAVASIAALESLPVISQAVGSTPAALLVKDKAHMNGASLGSEMTQALAEWSDASGEATMQWLLAEWLAFYGPVLPDWIRDVFGFDAVKCNRVLSDLQAYEHVYVDRFRENRDVEEVCDRANLEMLLRLARLRRRPSFQALPCEALQLFLSYYQGVVSPGKMITDLQERLEQLFGLCLPADAWEMDVFPLRVPAYDTDWLDRLFQTSDLIWYGCGKRKTGFAFAADLALFKEFATGQEVAPGTKTSVTSKEITNPPVSICKDAVLPDHRGHYSFFDIMRHTGKDAVATAEMLWSAVWAGEVSNDGFSAMRDGLQHAFKPARPDATSRRSVAGQFNRWRSSRPIAGNWYALPDENPVADALDIAEMDKERVRQLLLRYGVLFCDLLVREAPLLQWRGVFRTLRLMALSGEVLTGHFFEGIQGVQFISHDAFGLLQEGLPHDAVYWINAADPASVCGLTATDVGQKFPERMRSTWIVMHGIRRIMTSRRNHKQVYIHVPPTYPELTRGFGVFKVALTRRFRPRRVVRIETINDENASKSPYAPMLREFGFNNDLDGLEIRRNL